MIQRLFGGALLVGALVPLGAVMVTLVLLLKLSAHVPSGPEVELKSVQLLKVSALALLTLYRKLPLPVPSALAVIVK